jgi:hypothetical protein
MLIKARKRSRVVSRRSDGRTVGAAGAALASDTDDRPASAGSETGLRRDPAAGPDRLALAGRARAIQALGSGVCGVPALADRRDRGSGRDEAARQGRCRRVLRMGGLGRLHHVPRSSARRRCPQKRADDPARSRAESLAAEPDDHGLGRSRGGLPSSREGSHLPALTEPCVTASRYTALVVLIVRSSQLRRCSASGRTCEGIAGRSPAFSRWPAPAGENPTWDYRRVHGSQTVQAATLMLRVAS